MQSFYANYNVRHEISGNVSFERLTRYPAKISILREYFANCRCTPYGERVKDDCNNISVVKRIGGPSAEGEVYDTYVTLPDESFHFASKIMPITDTKSAAKNINEITIATQASDLVLNGICEYFPIVYSSNYCDNVIYNEGSALKNASTEWIYKQQLLKLTENTPLHKRAAVMVRLPLATMQSEIESKLGRKVIFVEPKSFPAHILVSEMAWGDLNGFCKQHTLDDQNWDRFINMIFTGIMCLQKHLSVVHNDLHFGNILVFMNFNPYGIIPLIHDFGRSEKIMEKIDYIRDVEKLTESVLKTPTIPLSIRDKMDRTKRYAETLVADPYIDGKDIMDRIVQFYNSM